MSVLFITFSVWTFHGVVPCWVWPWSSGQTESGTLAHAEQQLHADGDTCVPAQREQTDVASYHGRTQEVLNRGGAVRVPVEHLRRETEQCEEERRHRWRILLPDVLPHRAGLHFTTPWTELLQNQRNMRSDEKDWFWYTVCINPKTVFHIITCVDLVMS